MITRLTQEEAIERLAAGGLVLLPTETNYALACLATDPVAVGRVIAAKGRPMGKPLPVLISDVSELDRRQLETPLRGLAEAFWPGPLTLVVPAFPGLAPGVTADTNMVGLRVSAHPVVQTILAGVGAPLVCTSANRSGNPAASTPEACDNAGLEQVDGLVDAGPTPGGRSTVLGLANGALVVHRSGPLSLETLQAEYARRR